jgi:hypothetical protein
MQKTGEPGPCELKERPHRADVEKLHEKAVDHDNLL